MQFYEFESHMENIEKSLEVQDRYSEIMSEEFLDDIAGYLVDGVIELLETELNTDLISWFVFETSFGKQDYGFRIHKHCTFRVKTIEDLWNLIHFTCMAA